MIYFDNAATSGVKPPEVVNAVDMALKNYSVNPGRGGYKRSVDCSEKVFECRKKVAEFFGADSPERVIFTANCTAAINTVIKGVCRPGDHIVASSLEHNAVVRPLYKLQRLGAEVDFAEVIFGDSEATARSFERLIRDDTQLVICTHASNVTGEILPIEKIGRICAEKGVPFLVDAAQTAGILDIDMKACGIDYLCIAPHKGLYSPMGTGVLISLGEIPDTLTEGGTGTLSVSYEQPIDYPERFESGTINVPGIMGLSAGVDFVRRKTPSAIYRHEMQLMRYIYERFDAIDNVVLYTPMPTVGKFVPTLSFNIRGIDSNEVAERLARHSIAVRAGLHCASMAHRRLGTIDTGTVRICCSYHNTRPDAEKLVAAVANIVKNS